MKQTFLESLYPKVIDGLPVVKTPQIVAAKYAGEGAEPKIDPLIGYYSLVSGAAGFVAGLPGFLLMPITLPADLVGSAALQLHMCAAIAHLGGEDIETDATRDACIQCLIDAGGATREDEAIRSRTGRKFSERVSRYAATRLFRRGVRSAAARVLPRAVPVVSGLLVGGGDAVETGKVGRCARVTFLA